MAIRGPRRRSPGGRRRDVQQLRRAPAANAGRQVGLRVAGTGLNIVVYVKDDMMFQVVGAPTDLTEAIVAALP